MCSIPYITGGPGASSLYGLLIELGPFLLSDMSLQGPEYERTGIPQLQYNQYGWQKKANILALSMPPPVGFRLGLGLGLLVYFCFGFILAMYATLYTSPSIVSISFHLELLFF